MSTHVQFTDSLAEKLSLADILRLERMRMLEPQDLPGRYGRVVRAIDQVLTAIGATSVVGGGWAVWRHGYVNRVTQDIDIVISQGSLTEFVRAAAVSGFQILPQRPGRWPKLIHKETNVQVDILPEGERPGVPPQLAPTTIPAPSRLGATCAKLRYMHLQGLIELKIAAGRMKDQADVVELLRANPSQVPAIRHHMVGVHPEYCEMLNRLVDQAQREDDGR